MKLRVLADDITVVHTDDASIDGDVNLRRGIISINPDQSPRNAALTLLHEVIHVIDSLLDIKLSEAKTRALEQGLGAFIRDNPETFDLMVKCIRGEKQWPKRLP